MVRVILLIAVLSFISGTAAIKALNGDSDTYTEEQLEFLKELTFTDFDGNEYDMSRFEGKVVLIDVWETWCTPCLVSFPHLDDLQQEFEDDFVVLALSPMMMDERETITGFIDEHDYEFVYAYNEEIAEKLEINSLPYKIYMGPDGNYIQTEIGNRGPDSDYETTKRLIEEYGQ